MFSGCKLQVILNGRVPVGEGRPGLFAYSQFGGVKTCVVRLATDNTHAVQPVHTCSKGLRLYFESGSIRLCRKLPPKFLENITGEVNVVKWDTLN